VEKGNTMSSLIATVLILLFSFYLVVSAIAGKGEPTSCYKWSYNHLDGYVADNVNYEVSNFILKKIDRFYEGQQPDSHNVKKNLSLQLRIQFVFSYGISRDKSLPADIAVTKQVKSCL